VRERIEYRFKVSSAAVFTLYSYSKALEYRFRVPTTGSLIRFRRNQESRRGIQKKAEEGEAKSCVPTGKEIRLTDGVPLLWADADVVS
jgi:hypothetical protein